MKDLMLDIETLGSNVHAPIIQIAAVYFDRQTGETGRSNSWEVNIEDAVKNGVCEGATIKWWLQQEPAIAKQVMSGVYSLESALNQFREFSRGADAIWSHATFDFVIVQEALKKTGGVQLPHKSTRDLRTLVDLAGLKPEDYPTSGKTHHALDDCHYQIAYTVKAFKKLGQQK